MLILDKFNSRYFDMPRKSKVDMRVDSQIDKLANDIVKALANGLTLDEQFEELKSRLIILKHEGFRTAEDKTFRESYFQNAYQLGVNNVLNKCLPDQLRILTVYIEKMIDMEFKDGLCARTDCDEKHRFTCSKCQSTSYCSKECSVTYWPLGYGIQGSIMKVKGVCVLHGRKTLRKE